MPMANNGRCKRLRKRQLSIRITPRTKVRGGRAWAATFSTTAVHLNRSYFGLEIICIFAWPCAPEVRKIHWTVYTAHNCFLIRRRFAEHAQMTWNYFITGVYSIYPITVRTPSDTSRRTTSVCRRVKQTVWKAIRVRFFDVDPTL